MVERTAPTSPAARSSSMPEGYCGCPIDTAFDAIGRKWSLQILRSMLRGQHRFNEFLLATPGLNPKVLSQRLKELEKEALIERRITTSRPPLVGYHLTEKGLSMFPILRSMARWSLQWAPEKIFTGGKAPASLEECLEQWQEFILQNEDVVTERRLDVVAAVPRRRAPAPS